MEQGKFSLSQKLANCKKVAIAIPSSEDNELLQAVMILFNYIVSKGKEASVVVGGEITEKQQNFFDKNKILYQAGSNPTSYVVSIDYGQTGLDKVTWDIDEKTGKVNFYLTPTQGEFDFNKVEYRAEGNDFDLTITLGVDSFSKLGKLYESSRKLFSDIEVISIFKGTGTLGNYTVNLPETSSMVYGIKVLIGDDLDPLTATGMIRSLLALEPLIEGIPRVSVLGEIAELTKAGGNWTEAIQNSYFSKSYVNLDLQIKLMHNLLVDRENRVIWSKVNNEEVKFTGVDKSSFDPNGRIIFNISDDFDLAFAVYELEKDMLSVVVESNNIEKYSALNIANLFGGEGDDKHASFVAENMAVRDFEKKVFLVLKDMYGVDVYGSSTSFRTETSDSKQNG